MVFHSLQEQLSYELPTLQSKTTDPGFSRYLEDTVYELSAGKQSAEELRPKVIRNYLIYADVMAGQGTQVDRRFAFVIYGNDMPTIEDAPASDAGSVTGPAPQPMYGNSMPDPAPQSGPIPQQAYAASQPGPVPQPGPSPQQMYSAPQPKQKMNGVEFAVGGVILAIVGAFLVLAAGMTLAINYLGEFFQGMMLYVGCIFILLISELLIRRRIPKFSAVLSAISLSGLLLSTIANYMGLKIFNIWTTIIILTILSRGICVFAFIRKSALFSAVGFVTSFSCYVALGMKLSPEMFLILVSIALLSSLLWVVLPANSNATALVIIELVANTIFMMICSLRRLEEGTAGLSVNEVRLIFIIASWVIFQIVYVVGMIRSRAAFQAQEGGNTVNIPGIFYLVCSAVYAIRARFPLGRIEWGGVDEKWNAVIGGSVGLAAFVLPALICLVILLAQKDRRWNAPYFSALMMVLMLGTVYDDSMIFVLLLSVLTLLVRVMSRTHRGNTTLSLADLLVILFLSIYALYPIDDLVIASLVLLGITVIALLIGGGFTTAAQSLLALSLAGQIYNLAPVGFRVPCAMAAVLVALLAVNTVPFMRVKVPEVFNWLMLVAQVVLLIALNDEFSTLPMLEWVCCFVIGLGTCLVLLHPHYRMPFHGLYIIVSIYMTYMAMVFPDLPGGAILSGIWMLIALISVILGFAVNQKSIRIYGLVLALLVCAKMIFRDFNYFDSLQKTVLYFVVGLLALAISGIYFVLERRESRENTQAMQSGVQNAAPGAPVMAAGNETAGVQNAAQSSPVMPAGNETAGVQNAAQSAPVMTQNEPNTMTQNLPEDAAQGEEHHE